MPNHNLTRLTLLTLATAALTGCGKKDAPKSSVPLVAENARSKAFEATVTHLDVGGPIFAFADTEGDPKRVADAFLNLYAIGAAKDPSAPKAPATLDPFLVDLGLANIHATGFSSRRDGDAFVNRSFLYTPGGPAGLATIFGSKNAPFTAPALAPAGTLFVAEGELDGAKLLAIARAVAGHIGDGKTATAALEKALKQNLPNSPFTGERLLNHLSGHSLVGIQVSSTEHIPAGRAALPAIDFAVALDNRETLFLELSALAGMGGEHSPMIESTEGDFTLLTLREKAPGPYARYAPVLALQKSTKRLWLATNRATLDAWTKPAGAKLAASPEFARLSAGLSTNGIGFAYVSPTAAAPLRDTLSAVMANVPESQAGERKMIVDFYGTAIDGLFPKNGAGYYCASFVTADGLASESRAPISNKPNAYLWMSNSGGGMVVVGGLGAALAIPAFKKVRNNAIEKTMINDARQVSSAANQVWSENAKTSCRLSDIVGPNKYISMLSAGARIGVITPANQHPAFADLLDVKSPEAGKLILRTGGKFVIGNATYDKTLSSNPIIGADKSGEKNTLTFTIDEGMISPGH